MTFQRLSGRIGLPFALFVLVGSVMLLLLTGWNLANDDRERFEKLARTNADFMNRVKLPPSPRMADELQQVLGISVFFRKEGALTPEPARLPDMMRVPGLAADVADTARAEVEFEIRRIRLIYNAIAMAVVSALLICVLIALAFIDAFVAQNFGKLIAALFVLSLAALIASLTIFLREIFLSVNSPRAPVV